MPPQGALAAPTAEEAGIVGVEWRVPGEPVVFTLGSGPWISVGWNDAGLSVTGNEVSPNDERVGVSSFEFFERRLDAGTPQVLGAVTGVLDHLDDLPAAPVALGLDCRALCLKACAAVGLFLATHADVG